MKAHYYTDIVDRGRTIQQQKHICVKNIASK